MASDNITRILTELGMRLEQQEQQIQVQAQQIQAQAERIKTQEEQIKKLTLENKRLQQLLHDKGSTKGAKPPQFNEDYSVDKNTGKGKSKRGRQATGRRPQESKLEQVGDTIDLYEVGVDPGECVERCKQYVWRLVNGQATYICYRLFARPNSMELPSIVGVRNRLSEYGLEIILVVAFLHYWVGISLDHTCGVVEFFTGLALSKSQANSLLEQLSHDWQEQYEVIAQLLSYQMVLYVDETGWKVGQEHCYTWAFSTAMHVLFRCGVGRGKAEAQAILGEKFAGIGVTDDYKAYQSLFREHQLCWAHLLRKAIKLMLQHPDETHYQTFLDRLYRIYQQAVRWQKDQRLSTGRADKVNQMKVRIRQLCRDAGTVIDVETMSTHQQTFIRLQNELVNGLDALFVFVAHPQVEPTNNRSERNVRREAEVRKGGRTSKSEPGAKRRGIIMTVLATLNTRFESLTLHNLLNEVTQWIDDGISLFQTELDSIKQVQVASTA